MTTATEAKTALFGAIRTGWLANSTSAQVVLHYMDVKQELPTTTNAAGAIDPFARISMTHAGGAQESMGNVGNRRFSSFGVATVQIFTDSGDGNTLGYVLSGIARGIMQGIRDANGIRLFNISPPLEIGLTGAWLQVNVNAEFEYNEVA